MQAIKKENARGMKQYIGWNMLQTRGNSIQELKRRGSENMCCRIETQPVRSASASTGTSAARWEERKGVLQDSQVTHAKKKNEDKLKKTPQFLQGRQQVGKNNGGMVKKESRVMQRKETRKGGSPATPLSPAAREGGKKKRGPGIQYTSSNAWVKTIHSTGKDRTPQGGGTVIRVQRMGWPKERASRM